MKKIVIILGSLLASFTLLTCALPVEDFLNEQGDEVRLTDNAAVEYDPVFYETLSYIGDIENAMIAYHDGEAVHLYDYPTDTDEIIYNAPAGYTITAMNSITEGGALHGLVLALEGNREAIIVQEEGLEFTEIYREEGEAIDSISCFEYTPDNHYFVFERDGGIFYGDTPLENPSAISNEEPFTRLTDGSCPVFKDHWKLILYIKDVAGVDCIYLYDFYLGDVIDELFYSDGSNFDDLSSTVSFSNDYDVLIYATSDREGEFDIWRCFTHSDLSRVTDKSGIERDICAWNDYVVFVRTVDGQSDIYIVRGF